MRSIGYKLAIITIKFITIIFIVSGDLFSQSIDPNYLMENLKVLTSKEFQGRKPGTEAFKLSETFLSEKFKEIGLTDITSNYQQVFDLPMSYVYDASSSFMLNVIVPKLGVPLEKIKPRINVLTNSIDWAPYSLSSNGSFDGEVAFLGYGITAKDLNYDDYAGIDITGKAVIILTNSPDGEKKDSKFATYSRYSTKIKNAVEHGAKAVIFLKIQGDSANVFQPMEYFEYDNFPEIIAVQGNRTTISKYFPNSAQLMSIEQKINSTKQPNSFLIPNATVNIKVNLIKKLSKTSNIVGFLEGTDPKLKNEVVVLGAHYDHLGLGALNSLEPNSYGRIHYGADDNASGTAGVVSIAKYLKGIPPKRSVLFVLFTAEESGLLGSKYFVSSDLMSKYNIVTMLNLDMIGRYKEEATIRGVGTSSMYRQFAELANNKFNLNLKLQEGGRGPSDHQPFYLKDIPVMFFYAGFNKEYHTPGDTFDKVNKTEYTKMVDFILDITNQVANYEGKIDFKKVD